jgi:hypothetical protein
MSLITTRIKPTEQTNPDLDLEKIKVLPIYWNEVVQHLINSLNILCERGYIVILLTDEETDPNNVEMTCLDPQRK